MMKLGLLGTGYIALGPEGTLARADSDGFTFESPSTRPWLAELPLPAAPVEVEPFSDCPADYAKFIDDDTQFFEIEAVERWVRFHPDLPETAIWGYRDMSPAAAAPSVLGPTFKQRFGPYADTFTGKPKLAGGVVVRHHNNLPENHSGFGVTRNTVHFHGGHVQARADGFPEDLLSPPPGFPNQVVFERGEHYDYCYPMLDPGFVTDFEAGSDHVDHNETPSTLWYHDHLLDFTGPNVYRGLAGFFLAFDDPNANLFLPFPKTALDVGNENDPRGLHLPSGKFDIPIVIQDKSFDAKGNLVFSSFDHDGFLGDKICLNGAIQPYLRVERRKYRFRFLNGSNARMYQLFLADESGARKPMTQIAVEGGLLAAPIPITNFLLYMAERIEVVIDFSDFNDKTELFLENRLSQTEGRKPDGVMSRGPQILKFIVDGDKPVENASRVPPVLRPFAEITKEEKQNAVRRTFEFDRTHGAWAINGEFAGQLQRPIATPTLNQPEIWRLVNNSGGWWHPVHIHSEFNRVLLRNGKLPPLDERDGMAKKDTLLLRGGESVEIFFKFRDHPGPWVFHCHNMEHEDMAMMARFDIKPEVKP